jgi:hypothetical protein
LLQGVEFATKKVNLAVGRIQYVRDALLLAEIRLRQPDALEITVTDLFAIPNADHGDPELLDKFNRLKVVPVEVVIDLIC